MEKEETPYRGLKHQVKCHSLLIKTLPKGSNLNLNVPSTTVI